MKFRSNLGTQGNILCSHGAPPVPQLPNKPRSLRTTHSSVLTLLAATPFQEVYPGSPAEFPRTPMQRCGQSRAFPSGSSGHQPAHGGGSRSPARTLTKGGQSFPRTLEVITHRKYYLEPKRRNMVAPGGLSSSGTAGRSKNPVSQRVCACNTLFSAGDKGRIDCSPLKGRGAARPCLPPQQSRKCRTAPGTRGEHHPGIPSAWSMDCLRRTSW